MLKKSIEQIQRENEDITETSLSLMQELVDTVKEMKEVLTDIAAMLEELTDGNETEDED